jgi:hypothetical protein
MEGNLNIPDRIGSIGGIGKGDGDANEQNEPHYEKQR